MAHLGQCAWVRPRGASAVCRVREAVLIFEERARENLGENHWHLALRTVYRRARGTHAAWATREGRVI